MLTSAEYQKEILSLMARNERKLAGLYAAYGKIFPGRSDFWLNVSKEEMGHALWVDTFAKYVSRGDVSFEAGRFNVDVLNDFFHLIDSRELQIREAMPLINALEAAKEIEQTMLEKSFFVVFEGDSPELQILLTALDLSTEKHREQIEAELAEERGIIEQNQQN